jgi:hypothetical protein
MIKSRKIRWARHIAQMGRRGMHIGYWWEYQKERDHWEDQYNIKMDLREIGWDGTDWSDLAQNWDQWRALVNTVMNLWVS